MRLQSLLLILAFCLLAGLQMAHAQFPVVFKDITGGLSYGNLFYKTAPTGWGNSGAASANILPAGKDGWIETTVYESNLYRMIGFSSSNPNADYTTVEYGLLLGDGNYAIYESPNATSATFFNGDSYTLGDIFRIERNGNTVRYLKNGIPFYTSAKAATGPLLCDISMFSQYAMMSNVVASFAAPDADGAFKTLSINGPVSLNSDNAAFAVDSNANGARLGIIKKAGQLPVFAAATGQPIVFAQSNKAGVNLDIANASLTEFMRISPNGNVGIGTSNPDAKLTVAGNIRAREVRISVDAGADFVFEKDYRLMPLAELEKFVTTRKHLPGILPEKQMQEEGLGLKEMNIRLLQKVEELTLYMIEKDKQVKKLQKDLQLQASEIKKLKQAGRR